MEIKGLIFDMDGTLIDSMGASRAYKRTLCEKHNIPITDTLLPLLDYHSSWEALRMYLWTNHGLFETPAEFWDTFYKTMARFYEEKVDPLPGTINFLQAMKSKGYKLGVATATPRPYACIALERTGLLPSMDAVVSTKDIGVEKHRPDVYLECARQMGNLSKNEIVVFEDDFFCAKTLHNNDFTIVGFRDRHTPPDQLEVLASLCVRTISDYNELL